MYDTVILQSLFIVFVVLKSIHTNGAAIDERKSIGLETIFPIFSAAFIPILSGTNLPNTMETKVTKAQLLFVLRDVHKKGSFPIFQVLQKNRLQWLLPNKKP